MYTLYKAYKIISTPKTDVIINLYITDPYTELNHLKNVWYSKDTCIFKGILFHISYSIFGNTSHFYVSIVLTNKIYHIHINSVQAILVSIFQQKNTQHFSTQQRVQSLQYVNNLLLISLI